MDSSDFLMNMAANLAYDVLKAALARLRERALGDEDQRVLQHVYQQAFYEMLKALPSSVSQEELRYHLESWLQPYFRDAEISSSLLEVALDRKPLPIGQLEERFKSLGFDPNTSPISLTAILTSFSQALEAALKSEADHTGIFAPWVVHRLDYITHQLEGISHKMDTLLALETEIERITGQRVVNISGSVTESIIVLGDNNHISLRDNGFLARRWQVLQMDDAAVQEAYREKVSQLYNTITFPVAGLDPGGTFDELYQPLRISRAAADPHFTPLTRQPPIEAETLIEEMDEAGYSVVLGANLGAGKTTTLQYLVWLYSSRPPDRLPWRIDELLPFYLTARDLAKAWQDASDQYDGYAKAIARSSGYILLDPLLVKRALRSALKDHRALLLVDALDEYEATPQERRDFATAIHRLWESDPWRGNLRLLTSRPYQFRGVGLRPYTFLPLDENDIADLSFNLGKVWRRLYDPKMDEKLESDLRDLVNRILSPHFREFRTPFYITLLTWLACSEKDLSLGLQRIGDIHKLADIYRFFLGKIIQWEESKGRALPCEERLAFRALADLAFHTFPDPLLREHIAWTPLPEDEKIWDFWTKAGLLRKDEFTQRWEFVHSGFQAFGTAWLLEETWSKKEQQQKIETLLQQTGRRGEWQEVRQIFLQFEENKW